MNVELDVKQRECRVRREHGDERVKSESELLYEMKRVLNGQGWDLVKKLMWRDGHMVSDTCHCLRSRSSKKGNGAEFGGIIIWDDAYAVRNAAEDYNGGKEVCYRVETGID